MKQKKLAGRLSITDRIFDWVNFVIMLLICLVILYPLYFVFVASFTEPHVVNSGELLLYPKKLFLGGYERIFTYTPLWRSYLNTIIYTVTGTAVSLMVTLMGAYALSRQELFLRRKILFLYTFTMFFSGGLIPMYLLINNLKIYDTIFAIILPGAVSVWNLIVCRTFFESNIPKEMLEAAQLDGCTDISFFFRIVLPISPTIITVMVLFYATGIWNSFMNALMFLGSQDKMPLQVILRNLIIVNQATGMATDATEMVMRQKLAEQLKYGVIVVSAFPLLLTYPFLQKYFAKGIMIGAVKG